MTGDPLALFLNLYLGHLLGDFVLQPGKLVLAKRRSTPALLLHAGIVGACCTAVLIGQLPESWLAIALIVGAHALIELVTIYTYRGTPTRGLFTFLLDQVLHILSIVALSWMTGSWHVDRETTTFGQTLSIGSLSLVVAFVAVGFMGSILVFEAANSLLRPRDHKGVVLHLDGARIAGILERLAALAAAVWLAPWALPVPFLPRFALAWRLTGEDRARHLVALVAGLVLCTLTYALLSAVDTSVVPPILP